MDAAIGAATQDPEKIMFNVINRKTGKIVGTYSSKQRARNARDKKDNEYGAYVHAVVEA